MAGLLDRALKVRQKAALENADDVASEDKARILADIDALFKAKLVPPSGRAKRRKHGLALPLAANAIGALVLALGILIVSGTANQTYAGATRGTTIGLVAEGRVIETLRQEAKAAVSEREQRIATIRSELDRLSREAANRVMSASPGSPASASAADPGTVLLETARNAALEKSLRDELAALEGDSARRLTALEQQRKDSAFFFTQLRGVYAEARDYALAGNADAARASAAAAELLLGRAAAGEGDPDLAALLREGNAALDAALGIAARPNDDGSALASILADRDRAVAALDKAEASARAASQVEKAARAEAKASEAELERARLSLAEATKTLASVEEAAREKRGRAERIATVLSEGVAGQEPSFVMTPEADEDRLLALLEAKLKVRVLADAPATARVEPGFQDDLDSLFAEIEGTGRRAGEEAAWIKAAEALAELRQSLSVFKPVEAVPQGGSRTVASATASAIKASGNAAEEYLARLDGLLADLIDRLR